MSLFLGRMWGKLYIKGLQNRLGHYCFASHMHAYSFWAFPGGFVLNKYLFDDKPQTNQKLKPQKSP